MRDDQLINLLGQGGAFTALIYVIVKVGLGLVAAIKDLRNEISAHTKTDVAAMAELRNDVAQLNARVDTVLDLTPVKRPQTHPRGVRIVGDDE